MGGIGRSGLIERVEDRRGDAVAHEHDRDLGDAVAGARRAIPSSRRRRRRTIACRSPSARDDGPRRAPRARASASDRRHRARIAVPGEQRRRHVLGDVQRRAGKLADIEISDCASAGPAARKSAARSVSSRIRSAESQTRRHGLTAPRIVASHRAASCSAGRRRRAPAPPPRT